MIEPYEAFRDRTRLEINRLKDEIIFLKAKLRTPHDDLLDALRNENANLRHELEVLREKVGFMMGDRYEAS